MENSTSILQMMFQWWLKVGNLPLQKPSLISLLMSFRVLASLSIFHLYLILYSFQSSELWIVDVDSKFNFSSYYIICCRRILHLSFGRRWSTYNFYMNKWRCGNFPSCCSWIISVAYPVNWQSSMDISLEIRTDNLNVDVPCAFACACVLVLGHGICIQSTICVLRIFVSVFLFFLERREKMDEYKNTKQKKKEQDALGVRTICMCHICRTFCECFGENFDFVLNYFVFLEWFQVLSAPYLQSMPAAKVQVSMSWTQIILLSG